MFIVRVDKANMRVIVVIPEAIYFLRETAWLKFA